MPLIIRQTVRYTWQQCVLAHNVIRSTLGSPWLRIWKSVKNSFFGLLPGTELIPTSGERVTCASRPRRPHTTIAGDANGCLPVPCLVDGPTGMCVTPYVCIRVTKPHFARFCDRADSIKPNQIKLLSIAPIERIGSSWWRVVVKMIIIYDVEQFGL